MRPRGAGEIGAKVGRQPYTIDGVAQRRAGGRPIVPPKRRDLMAMPLEMRNKMRADESPTRRKWRTETSAVSHAA